MQRLFINLNFKNCTLMTGFVVQGHVLEFCTNLQGEKFTWRHILCVNSPLLGFGSGDFSLGTSGSIKQYFFHVIIVSLYSGKANVTHCDFIDSHTFLYRSWFNFLDDVSLWNSNDNERYEMIWEIITYSYDEKIIISTFSPGKKSVDSYLSSQGLV